MGTRQNNRIFKTRNFGLLIGLAVSALVCLAGFSWGLFGNLEAKLLDSYFYLKSLSTRQAIQKGVWKSDSNEKVSPDILIVGVDIKALQKFGLWPFPRSVHADLVNSFSRIQNQDNREKSILLDFFFVDDSGDPESDAALIESMSASGRIFLESILDRHSSGYSVEEEMFSRQESLLNRFGSFTRIEGDWKAMPSYIGLETNQTQFNEVAAGYGVANIEVDIRDNIVRRQPLVLKYSRLLYEVPFEALTPETTTDESLFERLSWMDTKGFEHQIEQPFTEKSLGKLRNLIYRQAPPLQYDADGDGTPDTETRSVAVFQDIFVPSTTFALALDYWGATAADCTILPGREIRVERATGEVITIPVDENCAMIINYAGAPSSAAADGYRTFPVRSYAGYWRQTPENPEFWPATRAVEGKVILVGAFDKGMADDQKQTPFGMMFGIEIHANSLNTLLTGDFVRHLPLYIDILITIASIMLVSLFAARVKNLLSMPLSVAFLVLMYFGSSFLFDAYGILINYSVPFAGMLFSYVAIILYRSSTEERDKRKIRAMFGKYVSPEVVAQMEDNPPELGGVDRELTVFFSDIRGFTSLSETLTPQELVKHLNEYLSAMTDIILETGGTLDKYVGDEVMCFWGAPIEVSDHAYRACKCALMQKAGLEKLNENWPPEKRLAIGIGINTGIMTVGNMGSEGRMNYTLMGDNVNLGARLEGTNKVYGTMIIVSEYTYALVSERFVFRELDTIRVKGKNRPVVIYELLDEIVP